nr:hypothetical protein [uncultured Roseateles sp.]
MATGTYFGGQCFTDPFLATDAYVSAQHPTKFSYEGGCAYKITAISQGSDDGVKVKFLKLLIDDTETEACPATTWTEYTALSPCEYVTGTEAAEVSWMVAAVWLGVYGIKLLRRALP